jgi:hypothetical protein
MMARISSNHDPTLILEGFSMSDSELQQQRNASRSCNENVLFDVGFSRVGNSSLYRKGTQAYILSPGISKGKHEKYWFDIREANLQKIGESPNVWVLLRIGIAQ